jgi:hypothetical protein
MAIVRTDKRPVALQLANDLRDGIMEGLRHFDGLQAGLESLELELGLATEGEQAQRAAYLVLHYPKGSDTGHTLDECSEGCSMDEVLEELDEKETVNPSRDDIGDGSGTGG